MMPLSLFPIFFNLVITPISCPLSVLLFQWYCLPAEKSSNLPAFQLKHSDNLQFKNLDKVPLRLLQRIMSVQSSTTRASNSQIRGRKDGEGKQEVITSFIFVQNSFHAEPAHKIFALVAKIPMSQILLVLLKQVNTLQSKFDRAVFK